MQKYPLNIFTFKVVNKFISYFKYPTIIIKSYVNVASPILLVSLEVHIFLVLRSGRTSI